MSFIISEEIALKSHLAGMTVNDYAADQSVQGVRTVDVWFSIPDVEVRQMVYPGVTIGLLDIRPAIDRQHSGYYIDGDYLGTQVEDPNISYRYDIPVAYDLIYQITSWSRHPRHDRALIQQMLNKFPAKYGKLPVPTDNGVAIAYRSMFLDEFVKLDYVEDNRRTYKNSYTVRVVSEMTPAQAADAASRIVETVGINVTTSSIPQNYYPI